MKRINNLYLFCLCLITVFFCLKSDMDSDLFWHMATGRWIIENMAFPTEDMFSFVYIGAPWINLPWIFQTTAYLSNQALGYFGVLLLCATACSCSVILTWKTFEAISKTYNRDKTVSEAQTLIAFILFSMFLFFLDKRWVVRPEIFTALFIAAEVYIVSKVCLNPQKTKLLWLLPLIQIFWVNSHGMFILGYAIIGIAWLKHPKKVSIPLVLSVLASLLNPYGLQGALYPFYLRAVSADPIYRLISEGQALFDMGAPLDLKIYWVIWLASLLFSLKVGLKVLGLGYFILVAFLIFFSTTMVRNLAPAVLITLPFIMSGLFYSFHPYLQKLRNLQTRNVFVIAVSFTGLFCALIATDTVQALRPDFHFGTKISSSADLGPAAEFLSKNKLTDHVLSTPEFSNYMLWYHEGFQTFIDTRYAEVVPKDHFKRLFQLFINPQELEAEALKYGLRTIALNHTLNNYRSAVTYFNNSKNWRLVYFDHFIVIFVSSGYREDVILNPSIENTMKNEVTTFASLSSISHDDFDRVYQILAGGTALGFSDIAVSLFPSIIDNSNLKIENLYCALMTYNLSKNLNSNQYIPISVAAQKACESAYNQSGDHSMAFNLGMVYFQSKMPQKALALAMEASEKDPNAAQYYIGISDIMASIDDKKYAREIEKNYLKGLELNPFQVDAWISLARLYVRQNKNDQAMKSLTKALSYNVNNGALESAMQELKKLTE